MSAPPADGEEKRVNNDKVAEKIDLSNVENLTLQVSRYNAAKEEKRLEKIRLREVEELKDCTFQPRLNTSNRKENCGKHANSAGGRDNMDDSYVARAAKMKKKNKAVVVRGLGRYLELKHLAAQKESEQKEREKRAYGVAANAYNKYPDGTTQVRAFRLSEGGGDELKQRLKKEREEYIKQQCTFQPDTIEKRNRAIIQALLEEEDEVEETAW